MSCTDAEHALAGRTNSAAAIAAVERAYSHMGQPQLSSQLSSQLMEPQADDTVLGGGTEADAFHRAAVLLSGNLGARGEA